MIIVDAHEDLAYNALVDGRDYLRSALETRVREGDGPETEVNGICMVGLPEWLRGNVAVVCATLLAIPRSEANRGEPGYPNPEAAHQLGVAQLNIYRQWSASHPQVTIVTHWHHLDGLLDSWVDPTQDPESRRVGLVMMIENADIIRGPEEVGFWYEQGVRLIGPAWHTNRYTGSSNDGGPLTDLGRALLDEMAPRRMILDLSHMSEEACLEALDRYAGTIVATHANPRRMVPYQRLLSDDVIKGIAAHNGVVGIMPVNWALDSTWPKHRDKDRVTLDAVVDAIDAVCQITSNADHVGIGTDFDGGQGREGTPRELDTVADLPLVAERLDVRGYGPAEVEAIMSGNWLRVLRRSLAPNDPSSSRPGVSL
jgi:membrane dipeptidase